MDDTELARLRARLAQIEADHRDKMQLITELAHEAADLTVEGAELARQINDEMDRRKDTPGNVLYLPKTNGPKPTDQGSY